MRAALLGWLDLGGRPACPQRPAQVASPTARQVGAAQP
jgi:hypothetical protein